MEKKDKISFIGRAIDFVVGSFRSVIDDNNKKAHSEGYADAIILGIHNTIYALYEAGIKDDEIIRIAILTWDIPRNEAIELLCERKKYSALNALRNHLELKGYSEEKIKAFLRKTRAWPKIQENSDLWPLWRQPEKLYKEVQKEQEGE